MTQSIESGHEGQGELSRFVSDALSQIILGVSQAQAIVDPTGAQINPVGNLYQTKESRTARVEENRYAIVETVSFDIAITKSTEETSGAGGGIRVMGIGVNADLDSSSSATHVSRLRFSIPVIFPGDPNLTAEEEERSRREALEKAQRRSAGQGDSSWI